MASVVVVGAGVVGLGAAMLLARDGHSVTVLDRDPDPPPNPDEAWHGWARKGVNQFHQPHFFVARWRQIVDAELPDVASALEAAGALRLNYITDVLPERLTGGWRPGDELYEVLTGRRPVVEAALAAAAESTPGLEVRRGCPVAGVMTGPEAMPGVPNVCGVRLESGETLGADLVVDAAGRRSALPRWLEAAGARAPVEELEDSGFMYFGRHFRARDGAGLPVQMGGGVINVGTISSLSLVADNDTWALGLVTASRDRALLGLRDPARWEAVVRSLPLVAHWLDGDPIDDGVKVLAKLEDRHRAFVVDGKPVATGVVAVGDSWACSNPANGRGASIGMIHAAVLRDQMRAAGGDNPAVFADAFHAATTETVEPWYRATLAGDRHRLGEIEAGIQGRPYETDDPIYAAEKALGAVGAHHPDCLRAGLDIRYVLRRPDEVFADESFLGYVLDRGAGWRELRSPGPDREDLLRLVAG